MVDRDRNLWLSEYDADNTVRPRQIGSDGRDRMLVGESRVGERVSPSDVTKSGAEPNWFCRIGRLEGDELLRLTAREEIQFVRFRRGMT
jgi:hypothetical protein